MASARIRLDRKALQRSFEERARDEAEPRPALSAVPHPAPDSPAAAEPEAATRGPAAARDGADRVVSDLQAPAEPEPERDPEPETPRRRAAAPAAAVGAAAAAMPPAALQAAALLDQVTDTRGISPAGEEPKKLNVALPVSTLERLVELERQVFATTRRQVSRTALFTAALRRLPATEAEAEALVTVQLARRERTAPVTTRVPAQLHDRLLELTRYASIRRHYTPLLVALVDQVLDELHPDDTI